MSAVAAAFVEDEDYPFEQWAADFDIVADELCGSCLGDGHNGGVPCGCVIARAFASYPAAAEVAAAVDECPSCSGDGETYDGQPCPCTIASFRAAHEAIDWD